jgi:hypothetical protein
MFRLAVSFLIVMHFPASLHAQEFDHESVDRAELLSLIRHSEERATEIEERLLPIRLLRPNEEEALRQFGNTAHLERARALGITPIDTETGLEALIRNRELVRLADSTAHWVVRDLDASIPYVTPDVAVYLHRLGDRFQRSLAEIGLPPYRFEISSVLRTGALQEELRETNENASRGRSSHEYGTTVDISYEAYAAPQQPIQDARNGSLILIADRIEALYLERVAARKSRELTAILGRLLRKMQEEGLVLVRMERLQPVFHVTVARRM